MHFMDYIINHYHGARHDYVFTLYFLFETATTAAHCNICIIFFIAFFFIVFLCYAIALLSPKIDCFISDILFKMLMHLYNS